MIKKNNIFLLSCALLISYSGASAKPVFLSPNWTAIGNSMQKAIKGKITDEQGNPIAGATIRLQNSSQGTVSASDGTFTINANLNDIIEVSFVGYDTSNFTLTSENPTFQLLSSSQDVEEVIVIGYGTTTRKSVVGAVDQIGR